jgi:hypothetical protein
MTGPRNPMAASLYQMELMCCPRSRRLEWNRRRRLCHPDRSEGPAVSFPQQTQSSPRAKPYPLIPERSRGICGAMDPSWKCFSRPEQSCSRFTQGDEGKNAEGRFFGKKLYAAVDYSARLKMRICTSLLMVRSFSPLACMRRMKSGVTLKMRI